MAQILVRGAMATVELKLDEPGLTIIAECIEHSHSDGRLAPPGDCSWTRTFVTYDGALSTPDVERHADTGSQR